MDSATQGKQLTVLTFPRLAGDALQNVDLLKLAWDEFEELQVRDKHVWLGQSLIALGELNRFEIAVLYRNAVIGAAVLADDPWDAHVGPCMSVFAQYVMPEFRNRGVSLRLMREAVRLAHEASAGVLAYTHRVGPWRYQTTYKRLT